MPSPRMNREISYGEGGFEKLWAGLLVGKDTDLVRLDEVLALWLPFRLTDSPEPQTVAMQLRNELKELLYFSWMMGSLHHDTEWLRQHFAAELKTCAEQTAARYAVSYTVLATLTKVLSDLPDTAEGVDRWLREVLQPCARTLQGLVPSVSGDKEIPCEARSSIATAKPTR